MPTYQETLSTKNYQGNIVIRFNKTGPYYTLHPVDSDSSALMPSTKNGFLQIFTMDPQTLDILSAQTSFDTFTFAFVDKNLEITALFLNNKTSFTGQTVEVWLGRVGIGMDFSDYYKLQNMIFSTIDFQDELYTFGVIEISSLFKRTIFQKSDIQGVNSVIGATSITATNDISAFPASGQIQIDNEFLNYSSITGLVLNLSSPAIAAHNQGATIYNSVVVGATNPIDLFLQICISGGGGGTYDVLSDGLGIDPANFDIAELVALKASNFPADLMTFTMANIGDALAWLTAEIFLPNNLRMVYSSNSVLTLVLLDQVIFGKSILKFDPTNVVPGTVTYHVDDTQVKNVIKFNYDYDYVNKIYKSQLQTIDQISIDAYGAREPLVINSKGITTANNGLLIALDRNTKWLGRLKDASPIVTLSTQTIVHLAKNGERVQVQYNLPTPFGTRGFNYELEVTQRQFDVFAGQAIFTLGFTGYSGLREGFISPADYTLGYDFGAPIPYIEVANGNGSKYKVGWIMDFYDSETWTLQQSSVEITNIISGISGAPDIIQFAGADIEISGDIFIFQFSDFENVSEDQKRYAFISNGSNNLPDGTVPYQITY